MTTEAEQILAESQLLPEAMKDYQVSWVTRVEGKPLDAKKEKDLKKASIALLKRFDLLDLNLSYHKLRG